MVLKTIVVVAIFLALFFIVTYNKLKTLSLRVDTAYADLDVFLTQRFDTLTKLIDTVKQFVEHENQLLTNLTAMRESLLSSKNEQEKLEIHEKLEKELKNISARFEAYPTLQSSENFQELQKAINYVEENISAARVNYNANVNRYNTKIALFPSNFVASLFSFKEKNLFLAEKEKREDVNISDHFQR